MCFTFSLTRNLYRKAKNVTYPSKEEFIGFKFNDRVERLSIYPFIMEPNKDDILKLEYYKNFKANINYSLAYDKYFSYIKPMSNEAKNEDPTYYMNRVKLNYDNKIQRIMKDMVVKDLIDIGVSNEINLLTKSEILDRYNKSDYIYKDDLYKELNEIAEII